MWPKAFAQLMELLPHITRLIPMADMFFQTKTASEKNNEALLKTVAEEVRADLGKMTSAHDSLYRRLQAQGTEIAELQTEITRTRVAMETYAERLAAGDRQTGTLKFWLQIVVGLLVLVLMGILALFARLR